MRYVNKAVMTDIAKVTVVGVILLIAAVPEISYGAGHFAVAFQRQFPAWENSAGTGCLGGRVCRVWVWDEDGNPVPNIQLKTTWDLLMGATDSDGRVEIPVNMGDDFDLVCVDGAGATSESTRLMTSNRPECWGHYSFEVGFLYKTDVSNPGEFDLDMNGTWNEPTPAVQDDDAPYTKSLAYNGVDSTDYWSDQSYWGNWQNPPSYFGQTFVATGNRVVAARVQGIIGGNDLLDWQLQIVTFPGLVPVGPVTSVPVRFPFGWEAFWGVNDCPVVAGQTYMLKVWRNNGGMNIYHVTQDVYPNGQYYEGTTAYSGFDLNGHICCMNTASLPDCDFNQDGKITFKDICILAQYFSGDEPSVDVAPPPAGDNTINHKDLAVLILKWLTATTIPPLPGQASNPNPGHGAMSVNVEADLSWTAGTGATSYDVYLGMSSPPTFIRNQTGATFDPGGMAAGTQHYWRIDSVNGWGKTEGQEWMFSTGMPPPPPPPP